MYLKIILLSSSQHKAFMLVDVDRTYLMKHIALPPVGGASKTKKFMSRKWSHQFKQILVNVILRHDYINA